MFPKDEKGFVLGMVKCFVPWVLNDFLRGKFIAFLTRCFIF